MRGVRVGSKFVLVMLGVMGGLRIGVGRCGMTLCGRRIRITVFVDPVMLSRLLIWHRVYSVRVLMLVFLFRCRDGKRSQGSLIRHRREADVLIRQFSL
jgi:hypothetical protein